MTPRSFVVPILLAFSVAAWADSSFSRTLQTSNQPDLYVSIGSGHLHITHGSDTEIHVVGHVHAGWSAFGDVGARIRQIVENPPITQAGNTIRIGDSNDRSLFNNISIDYDISVPGDVALNLRSGSGEVEVDHVARFVSATSGTGSVRLQGVHGPAEVGTGSGDIELEQVGLGGVRAKTGSGRIQIHGLDGAVNARTGSGNVEMNGRITSPSSIATGSGTIKLQLSPDSHVTLEASTGSGEIHVKLPGANSADNESRHHLTQSLNGGGPPLEIRTGSGDIEISGRS